jgi:AraC family transcriptional regulator
MADDLASKFGQDARPGGRHDGAMDSTTPRTGDPFPGVLDWLERQLDQPLMLEQIASHAGLSPYHFSRLFTARMGRSVMAHVRGRRLVRAARRLCDEPALKLVDLAFDCGFESQEAFTRAFKRLFGVSPGRFRSGVAVQPIEGPCPMTSPAVQTMPVVRLPELVKMPAFRVAGPSRRFDDATKAEIPQLWPTLIGALPFAGQVESWDTFGVVSHVDQVEGRFAYMAGVGVTPGAVPPPGFSTMDIPPATYVVFRITLDGTALHPQVKRAMAFIWSELIPACGLKLADGPDFERYDGRFDPLKAGSFIDFHVPVQA